MRTRAALVMRRSLWACGGLCVAGLLISTTVPAHGGEKEEGAKANPFRLAGDRGHSRSHGDGHDGHGGHGGDHAERLHDHLLRLTERVSMLHAELVELRATMAGIRVGSIPTAPAAPPHAGYYNSAGSAPGLYAPLPPMPAFPSMPAQPPMPDFHFIGKFPGGEEAGEWRERKREWQDEWRERSQETADYWREFAGEWRERQQEFGREWREHQRELTEQWREHHAELASEWRERQQEWQERQQEWQDRIRDRARDTADRVRDRVERVRGESQRSRKNASRAERERGRAGEKRKDAAPNHGRKAKDAKGAKGKQRAKQKAAEQGRKEKPAQKAKRVVYGVSGKKAKALYSLLAPKHVKVVVSHAGDNVAVKGTPKEQKALNAGLQLLGWIDRDGVFKRMREGDTVDHRYVLGEKRSKRLFQMLAPNSVKVVVSTDGDEAVSISGTKHEHKVLRDFLNLIGWKQKKK